MMIITIHWIAHIISVLSLHHVVFETDPTNSVEIFLKEEMYQ